MSTVELGVMPNPLVLPTLIARPIAPVVMVNLLVFREWATGEDFAGKTGREAYMDYVAGLVDAQRAIGSRMIWSGDVTDQRQGEGHPRFEVVALLEYATPQAFLKFAMKPGDSPQGRKAGLRGQWLIAATTLEENAPGTGPFLVELTRGSRPEHETGVVWRGRLDKQLLGACEFDEIVVRQFPDEQARTAALDERIPDVEERWVYDADGPLELGF